MDNARLAAIGAAKQSKCNKRKVGACVVDINNKILSTGFNHNFAASCEDKDGNTYPEVIHAEVAAIKNIPTNSIGHSIYVTHQPCANCLDAIENAGIQEIIVVEDFMKFDTGKLRYGLIPTSATKALAEVLTYGAKKYKPNNWKKVDSLDRYVDALYRHLEAWRNGEKKDKESKLPHLAHAITNIAFLLELDNKKRS